MNLPRGNFPYYKDGGHVVVAISSKVTQSTTRRRRLWQCFYQFEGRAMRCQYEEGGYGVVATNLKEETCVANMEEKTYVVIDANSKRRWTSWTRRLQHYHHQLRGRDIWLLPPNL